MEVAVSYLPILIFMGLATVLAIVMAGIPLLVAPKRPDSEKLSAYECGFEAFDDSRGRFDVRFYLVAILFIIFDLEVAFFWNGSRRQASDPWFRAKRCTGPGYTGNSGSWLYRCQL